MRGERGEGWGERRAGSGVAGCPKNDVSDRWGHPRAHLLYRHLHETGERPNRGLRHGIKRRRHRHRSGVAAATARPMVRREARRLTVLVGSLIGRRMPNPMKHQTYGLSSLAGHPVFSLGPLGGPSLRAEPHAVALRRPSPRRRDVDDHDSATSADRGVPLRRVARDRARAFRDRSHQPYRRARDARDRRGPVDERRPLAPRAPFPRRLPPLPHPRPHARGRSRPRGRRQRRRPRPRPGRRASVP